MVLVSVVREMKKTFLIDKISSLFLGILQGLDGQCSMSKVKKTDTKSDSDDGSLRKSSNYVCPSEKKTK